MSFDETRAKLSGPDKFKRFRVPERHQPLATAKLAIDESLQIVERGGAKLALAVRQMGYHHVAEGRLGGEPFVVTF